MEHRCGTRTSLVAEVVIQNRDQTPILGQTRNISLGGMFVDTKHAKLPVNTFVKVTVIQVVNKQQKSFCTPALVIHNKESGTGLMFIDLNAEAVQPLHSLLSHNPDPVGFQ